MAAAVKPMARKVRNTEEEIVTRDCHDRGSL
jgi:hypothetical protein